VGAALIIAPMYIAEISPAKSRGRMVSFNQLNIVIGISAAFFSNYLLITLADADVALVDALRLSDWQWRWMLGVEAVPAIIYFLALYLVPESPRWLVMKGRDDEALNVLEGVAGKLGAASRLSEIRDSLVADADIDNPSIASLLHPSLRLVLTIGISIGILQQITGINSVFFYAPMIFEQSGIGTSAAFMQAVLVGLVNLVFTIAALFLIDRLGRRPLLTWGMTGIAVCMLTLAYGFGTATYRLDGDALDRLPSSIDQQQIATLEGIRYESDREFRQAVYSAIGQDEYTLHESLLIGSAITINPVLILAGILGFVASFAISIGPIMWVLFSELFPNRIRGLAISFVGLINSIVAFLVTLVFPWQLENIGTSATFMIYGLFAMVGVVIVVRILPETKNRSLEELEGILVRT
jgi:MFS family permease